ncbi:uncharacterized protein C2orf16 homolog [Psammomys obesus]|uniref:uncharacterized protein C2orf16 homolog n=1 Tax=Psammomys obesus TaxID=48139 RepID=UPI0024529B7C|nr:uncharacterized protein C2orf16 homolog [Psammomys obesus]
MGTPPHRNLGVNTIQEETTLLKKDPKHVLELSIGQRVQGLPEKRIRLQKPQVTNVELTPKAPCSASDSIKVTPLALLQVMDSMGMIPESHSEVIESVGLSPQPPKQVETVQVRDSMSMMPQHQGTGYVSSTPGPPHQGMEPSKFTLQHQDLDYTEELQGDRKIMELTPRPSLEDTESVNLAPKPHSQNTTSDKRIHVLVLEDMKTPLVEGGSLIPEDLVESMKVCESIPSIQLDAVKSPEVSPDSSHHFLESEGLILQQQASEARVTSDTCHQVEESVELIQSSPPMTPAPLSQTSESMEMSLPPLQETRTLETRTNVVKGIEETLESQNTIKDSLDLLPESEVPNKNSEVMAPEPQPPDVKLAHVTLESCPEVTNPLDVTLRSEYEDTESVGLTLPKVNDNQGNIVEAYSEVVSLELSLESGVRCKESESFAKNLKSPELISESSELLVESMELTVGPKPQVEDVTVGPELHKGMSRQMDTESHLQDEQSVNLIQQPSVGVVDPEKTKPEPGLQSLSPKESIEGTQLPNMKSVDFNLGPQQPIAKSGLIPGPQLQSVRLPKLYQGGLLLQEGKPANLVSNYGVKSDEVISCSPVPEVRSSDFIPGPKVPEPQPQHMTPLDINLGPSLQDVKFSDLIPQPEHHGFRYVQFIPGIQPQEGKSQGFMPESLLPLSEEPPLKDMKLALPTEESALHSMKSATQPSELQCPTVVSERVSPGLWQQDNKISELASRPKLQAVKFGEQTPGSVFGSISARTPEFGIHDPKLAKMTPGLQDTRQVSFNSGPWLQDVKFFDVIPGTQPQGMKTSEVNSGPQLECVKMFELTTQPERQEMKSKLVVQEPLFQDVKYVTENQVPSFKDKMLNKMSSEPQISNAESMKLTPGIHLAHTDHSKLIRGPKAQTIESSEIIQGQHFGYIKPVEKITVSKHVELTSPELPLGLQLGEMKPMELRARSELGQVEVIPSTPGMQAGDRKHEPLPSTNPCQLAAASQIGQLKASESTLEPQLQGVKTMPLNTEPQIGSTKSIQWIPISEFQGPKGTAPNFRSKFARPTQLKLPMQRRGVRPSELGARSNTRGEKCVAFHLEPQLRGVKTSPPTIGLQKSKTSTLTPEPQVQGSKALKLNEEPQVEGVRSVQWIPGPEFHSVKFLGLNRGSPYQGAKSAERKASALLESGKASEVTVGSKPQGRKSVDFDLGSHEQNVVKSPELSPGPEQQKGEGYTSTSKPQLQSIKTVELKEEPQVEGVRSVQWIPGPEFHGVKFLGLNRGLPSQGTKSTERIPSILLGGGKPTELTVGSKLEGKKPVDFNLGLELRKGGKCASISELQSRGVKTVPLHHGPQLENTKSIQWIPVSDFQVKKSMPNLGLQSKDITAKELKPSMQLRDVKTPDELITRPKIKGKQPSVSAQEYSSHRFKTIDFKPELQFRDMKAYDPALRSKVSDINSMTFKPGFYLEDKNSAKLTPAIVKSLESHPGTQPQDEQKFKISTLIHNFKFIKMQDPQK